LWYLLFRLNFIASKLNMTYSLISPFLLICLFCCCVNGLFFGGGPEWDGLKITWNLVPFSNGFSSMPRTVSDAAKQGFTQLDDFCESDTTFRGIRYWKDSDPGVVLLYDRAGFIAGIQTLIPKDKLNPSAFNNNHPYVPNGDYYALTAYFVDPSIICTTGRTLKQYQSQGTGDRLVIQNGTDTSVAANLLTIPPTQTEIDQSLWTKGKCFWTMGLHYWYQVTQAMNCDNFYPFFLMYNGGKLNAFGFAMNAPLTSPRYEHPTPQEASHFVNPVPNCFFTDPTFAQLSTLHIYMIDNPRTGALC
jgi:hypothetical protein